MRPQFVVSDHDELVEVIVQGLTATKAAQDAIMAIRARDDSAPDLSRKALIEFARDVITDRGSIEEIIAGVLEDLGSRDRKELAETKAELNEMIDKLGTVHEALKLASSADLISVFLPHGALRHRYQTDHPSEKAKIAEYVVETFFANSPVRCFVQASTTAIHLGENLSSHHSIRDGSLIYTNSVVLPIAVLREGRSTSVYAFCGSIYDPLCGGWLFDPSDHDTAASLRGLFNRPSAPLDMSLIMPIAITLDGGICFLRGETRVLAEILVQEAKHVIIMATADRIHGKAANLDQGEPHFWLGGWPDAAASVDIVIAGANPKCPLRDSVEALAAGNVRVHWFDDQSDMWRVHASSKADATDGD